MHTLTCIVGNYWQCPCEGSTATEELCCEGSDQVFTYKYQIINGGFWYHQHLFRNDLPKPTGNQLSREGLSTAVAGDCITMSGVRLLVLSVIPKTKYGTVTILSELPKLTNICRYCQRVQNRPWARHLWGEIVKQ